MNHTPTWAASFLKNFPIKLAGAGVLLHDDEFDIARSVLSASLQDLEGQLYGMRMKGHHKKGEPNCAGCAYQYGVNEIVDAAIALIRLTHDETTNE